MAPCTDVVTLLSLANNQVVCCYILVVDGNASNNNGHIQLAFPTCNRNAVQWNVTSLLTPNCDFQG